MKTATRLRDDPLVLALAMRVIALSDRPMSNHTRAALASLARRLYEGEDVAQSELADVTYAYFSVQPNKSFEGLDYPRGKRLGA